MVNDLKTVKMLNADDCKKIGVDNIIFIDNGPVCIINDEVYEAKCYKFDTIEEFINHFKKINGTRLAYKQSRTVFSGNEIYLNPHDQITIKHHSTDNKTTFIVDTDCILHAEYKDDDINKCYKSFMISLYEKIKISSDTYKNCDTIDKCIIKDIESNLKQKTEDLLKSLEKSDD